MGVVRWGCGLCAGRVWAEANEKAAKLNREMANASHRFPRFTQDPPHAAFRMVDDSWLKIVGVETRIGEGAHEKRAAHRSVPPKIAEGLLEPIRTGYFPCFAYQSALIGVKLFHFSGRSSSAKIAVTGQTGTHAPQSMHSVGWIYSCVSLSKFASSLRG